MFSQPRVIVALTNFALLSAGLGAPLCTSLPAVAGQQGEQARPLRITTAPGQPLTGDERKQLLEGIHAVLKVPEAQKKQIRLVNARVLLADEHFALGFRADFVVAEDGRKRIPGQAANDRMFRLNDFGGETGGGFDEVLSGHASDG